ncbi:NigD1/NigD2 family lipoprotein [Bacteroidaceae bacterium]|jgi:hypothetical protein
MKKMKLAVVFAALVSVFGFSSCLDSGESGPSTKSWLVTVTGDRYTGFQFYADNGGILVPTSTSVSSVGENLEKVKRILLYYSFVNEETIPANPTETTKYDITFQGATAIDTKNVINLYQNENADTLITNKDAIGSFNIVSAYKGYITVGATFNYSGDAKKMPYMNMAYSSDVDVDAANNTLNLTLYYDNNAENAYTQASDVLYSFQLPSEVYGTFSSDSIKLVVKADGSSSQELKKEVKIAKSSLFPPRGY